MYIRFFECDIYKVETMGSVQSRINESDAGVREVFHGAIKDGSSQHSYQPTSHGIGALAGLHAKSGSVRGAPRQPMPDAIELERRFTKVLVSNLLVSECLTLRHDHLLFFPLVDGVT